MGRILAMVGVGVLAVLAAGLAWFALQPAPPPPPALPPPAVLASTPARDQLTAEIARLGQSIDGETGIAVVDISGGWGTSWNGDKLLPQQSVAKLWATLALLDGVDHGRISPTEAVVITKADLSIFNQPLRDRVGDGGLAISLQSLMEHALTLSDNAANEALVRRVGGPWAVQAVLAAKNLGPDIRFGPGERELQIEAAGLPGWKPEYSFGRAFWVDREALPPDRRLAALKAYLADPPDGATPDALADALARLYRGELLSPAGTQRMLSLMAHAITGPERLSGGLSPGWRYAHKTGTGQVDEQLATGFNDVGLLTGPDGRTYVVVVLIGQTTAPVKTRQAMMQAVTRAVIAYSEGSRGEGLGISQPLAPSP
ncbi:beta-lactamase class A [Caulobacter ginsengisoli]|uniref:beta-lactamase n=1 Tax=Caulobacter ginsengisoli TaxID=400775 RepID=A0ABU0IU01_9CAUL|nr:serine hydrolase [Caulobacter ginsengisoli]MDQ0464623.1 beta-lactamase class A [Caulobacter ginsengisoli]